MTYKGTIFRASLAFVEARHGAQGIDRLAAALDEETRQLITGLLLPSAKYPFRHLVALCETIDRVFGRGDLALCWELGKFSGEYEIKLLHKVFLQVAQLEYWLKSAGATWRFYYSAGKMTADVKGTHGRVYLTEFNPVSKAFCYRFGGWVHRIVELSRLKNVTMTHPECMLDGRPACVWEGSWTK